MNNTIVKTANDFEVLPLSTPKKDLEIQKCRDCDKLYQPTHCEHNLCQNCEAWYDDINRRQ